MLTIQYLEDLAVGIKVFCFLLHSIGKLSFSMGKLFTHVYLLNPCNP